MTTTSSRLLAGRTTLVVASAAALALAGIVPASAVDIVEGDRPIVLMEDQSQFAAIPFVGAADGETETPPEVEVLLFGGPEAPEITTWTATALSFDSEDRVFVALLTAPDEESYACAIRLYDAGGVPLGGAMPITNPGDGTAGLWPSPCEALALYDILAAYDVDIDPFFGGEANNRTHALVYFANGDYAEIDARSGAVLNVAYGSEEGSGSFGPIEALAISAGPASLLAPEEDGIVIVYALAVEDGMLLAIQRESGEPEGAILFFPLDVVGAEFDSELNLWIVARDGEGPGTLVLSLPLEDLIELGEGFGPTSATEGAGGFAGLVDRAAAGEIESIAAAAESAFESTAVSGGYLVTGEGDLAAGGIAIERGAVELAGESEAELADTGADDQLVLTVGIIAGALLIGGVVITAIGASRRRTRGQ